MAPSPLIKWLFSRNTKSQSGTSEASESEYSYSTSFGLNAHGTFDPPQLSQYQFALSPNSSPSGAISRTYTYTAAQAVEPPPNAAVHATSTYSPPLIAAATHAPTAAVHALYPPEETHRNRIPLETPPAIPPTSSTTQSSQYGHTETVAFLDKTFVKVDNTADPTRTTVVNVVPPVRSPAFNFPTPTKEEPTKRLFDTSAPPPMPSLARKPVASDGKQESNATGDARSSSSAERHDGEPEVTTTADTTPDGPRTPDNIDIKPTCSLNLVCYRSGASGCKLHQLHFASEARYPDTKAFEAARAKNPGLITSDADFFVALRHGYRKKMCGFWRRVFFLKTLRGLRLLAYTQNTRPTVVPLDSFVLQEVLYAYNHPSKIDTEHEWIDWVFALRQADKRHALEFVEGWNGTRIAIAGTIPLLFSTLVGLIWSIRSGDWQTAFTVAGFILTAGTLLLALLAVVSGIEASGKAATFS